MACASAGFYGLKARQYRCTVGASGGAEMGKTLGNAPLQSSVDPKQAMIIEDFHE
jgi:hypothetical protein